MEGAPTGMKSRLSLACLGAMALGALLFGATISAATTVVGKSFCDLCREADFVFVGSVVEVKSEWADDEHSRIRSAVTFADLRWVYGAQRPQVTLRFAGGEVDGITEVIGGMPRFSVGQRVLLFARDEESISPIVGFHQGCVGVARDSTGREVVISAGGRPVVGVGEVGFELGDAGADVSTAMSLDDVLAAVADCRRGGEGEP